MRNAAYGYVEMTDGTTVEGVRVTLASKIQLEKTARAHGWDPEANTFTVSAFLAWHAARAAGKLPADLEWEQFLSTCVDAGLDQRAPEGDDDTDPDPTQPGAITAPL